MESVFNLVVWWECRLAFAQEPKIEYWLENSEWRFSFAVDMPNGLRRGTVFSFQPHSFFYNVKRLRYFIHSALRAWKVDN